MSQKAAATPFFSVLFSVNRDSPYLEAAVTSILQQTYADFEFLICANCVAGKEEPDRELLRHLREICGSDQRVSIYNAKVPQLAYCLNYLAERASGEYLVRMDADDISVPERFSVLFDEIKKAKPDIIGSWAKKINSAGVEIGSIEPKLNQREIERGFIYSSQFIHPTVAIRRAFLFQLRGYAGGLVSQDVDFWLRAVRMGASLQNIPRYLLKYRVHQEQESGSSLGYAEIVACMTREFCLRPTLQRLFGVAVAVAKVFLLF